MKYSSLKKRFKIKSYKYAEWFWVYIYKDVEQLRIDADEHDTKIGMYTPDGNIDIMGICHSYTREIIHRDGHSLGVSKNIGIIRLADKYCSTLVTSHEVVHAAMYLYKQKHKRVTFNDMKNEEELAHIYGEMFRELTRKLYKYNIWN